MGQTDHFPNKIHSIGFLHSKKWFYFHYESKQYSKVSFSCVREKRKLAYQERDSSRM